MKKAGPYMQQAGKGPRMETGAGIPKQFMGPAMHEPGHEENDYKVNESGDQVAVRDTATDGFYHPTEAGLAVSKKIGSKPREFKGAVFGFDQSERAPGYRTPGGEMIRANNPRELEKLKTQYNKDLSIHTQQENRRVERGNIARGYTGKAIK
jgi:hypothetical protein